MFQEFPKNPLENGIEKLEQKMAENREEIKSLLKITEKNYSNFITPLMELERDLNELFTPIYHIHSVKNSEESKKIYGDIIPALSEYGSEVSQNLEIFQTVKKIKETQSKSLNIEQNKILDDSILDFQLSGAELPQDKKDRLKDIDVQLSDLSNRFSQNVLDDTNSFELIIDNPDAVSEIPTSDLESAKTEDGKWKFGLQMPSYLAYITYGTDRALREKLYMAFTSRGEKNGELINEILSLKYEKANILGFSNYAELSIATKMAKKTDDVINFLEKLGEKSKVQAKEELETIKKFSKLKNFQPFDLAYYSEKYKKEFLSIDEEEYRPYFEQSLVVDGVLNFIAKLFNIEFKKVDTELWDKKATTFDIYENGKALSRLYLDLEVRKDKKGGAWMNDWHSHHIDSNGDEQLATTFIVCNFAPSSENSPSLLRHDDIHTLLHEMGHGIHHLLSRVSEIDISGTNGVEWDAVEFPSQFLENFSYEPLFLKSFAKHYKTGESLSDEMIEKLVEVKNFQSALMMVRQIEFSLFDFKLYSKLYQGAEIQTLLDSIRSEFSPLIPPKYNKFQNSFSHIFSGGYSAGYYSYKWAELLSADMFYEFIDRGIFNKDLSKKYRDIVLACGGTKSMSNLFFDVLQREPDESKLLRLNGID